jgi:hypothetical protein
MLDLIARIGETRKGFVDLTEKFSLGKFRKKSGRTCFREPSTHSSTSDGKTSGVN